MRHALIVALLALPLACLTGCNVAPKSEDRTIFVEEARDGLRYFEKHVTDLQRQIRDSAGYAVFPGAGQWGIIFTGGSFGRGAVFKPDGTQIGWAAVNNFSLGLQAGGQGKKILIVFANVDVLERFKQGLLTGKAEGTAVAGDAGTAGLAPFQDGLAVYIGAQKGLMAGGMVAMENFRYRELGKEDEDPD
jgi:lipid-binding SYLF domain-containing protein